MNRTPVFTLEALRHGLGGPLTWALLLPFLVALLMLGFVRLAFAALRLSPYR